MKILMFLLSLTSVSAYGQNMFDTSCDKILQTDKKAKQATTKDQVQNSYTSIMDDFIIVNTFGGTILPTELMKLTNSKVSYLTFKDDVARNRVMCAPNAKGELFPVIITKFIESSKAGKRSDMIAALDAKYGKPIKSFELNQTLTHNKNDIRVQRGFGTVVSTHGDFNSSGELITYFSEGFVNSTLIPAVALSKTPIAGGKQKPEQDAKTKESEQKAKLKGAL